MIMFCAAYCATITVLSILSISLDWHVQFNMQDEMTPQILWRIVSMQIVNMIGLSVGKHLSRIVPQIRVPSIRLVNISLPWAHIFLAIIIIMFAQSVIFSAVSVNTVRSGEGIERVMHGKASQFMLILGAVLAVSNVDKGKFSALSVFLVVCNSALFAFFNGSRAAVLPVAIIFMYFAISRRTAPAAFLFCVTIAIFFASMAGRIVVSSYQFEWGSIASLGVLESAISGLHYFTTFSAMHASYAVDFSRDVFGWRELIYSLTPIPSSVISPPSSSDLWRIDMYRPLGGQAEMWGISPVVNLLFAVSIGYWMCRADRIQDIRLVVLIKSLLALSFCISFQYGLRTIQWFFWIAVITYCAFSFLAKYRR